MQNVYVTIGFGIESFVLVLQRPELAVVVRNSIFSQNVINSSKMCFAESIDVNDHFMYICIICTVDIPTGLYLFLDLNGCN